MDLKMLEYCLTDVPLSRPAALCRGSALAP